MRNQDATQGNKFARVFAALFLCVTVVAGQEPVPDSTVYSYSSYFLSQWTIVWDQYNRQRLPYFFCCFDFDRSTFEMMPEWHWVNSTAYLRAMMQGFVERLYPYTGDAPTLEFLQNFVDYELEHGLTPEGYAWAQVPY